MDEMVNKRINLLSGGIPFNGWTGFNFPLEIQQKSNIWIMKAGARYFEKGFTFDPEINNPRIEWGAISDGQLFLECNNLKYIVKPGMFYLLPDKLKISASVSKGTFISWIEFTGNINDHVLPIIGGKINEVITGKYTYPQIKSVLDIAYLLQYHPLNYSMIVQSMLWRFLAYSSGAPVNVLQTTPEIQLALNYIHKMPVDEKLSIAKLASLVMMSAETFRKRFQSEIGESPIKYLLHYRISFAKNLLSDHSRTIKQVAYESGFTDQYYFSRLFKHFEGMSPLLYRKTFFIQE